MMRRARTSKLSWADLPHVSTGKAKDGTRNDLGKTVKLDFRGRPYPVGADGFTMKTTRPAGFTPVDWATLRNAIDVDEEGVIHPKKKDGTGSSKDAAPAESTKVSAPSAKGVKAMLKERWGGDQWMYNWGIRKNSRTRLRSMGQFYAWTPNVFKILVQAMWLDEVYGILVVIYAWKFTPKKGRSCIYPKERP